MGGGKVFISYRRGRDSDSAGRLHDRLERIFGRERLFYDIDSIPPGVDFHHYLDQQVAQCAACLVVIGEGWLEQIDRLHDEDDFVRIEIAAALRRDGVRVIPVLVQGATMPKRAMLPEPIQPLSRRNAVEVPYAHFAAVVDGRVASAITQALTQAGADLTSASTVGLTETAASVVKRESPRPLPAVPFGTEMVVLNGHRHTVSSVAFSPDGTRLATGSGDNTARLWDVALGTEIARLEGHGGGYVRSVAFSPDGTRLATGSEDNTARLWDLATGKEIGRFDGHEDPELALVTSVAFSPDGTRLAVGATGGTALWDVGAVREIAWFKVDGGTVQSVEFCPGGTRLATASGGTTRLWDVGAGKEIAQFEGHSHEVGSVAFSRDGTWLATGNADGITLLWDVATEKEFARLNGRSYVCDIAFSPDGTCLATGSWDSPALLWDPVTGREIARLEHPPRTETAEKDGWVPWAVSIMTRQRQMKQVVWQTPVISVAFSPDGILLATGSSDNTARIWSVA